MPHLGAKLLGVAERGLVLHPQARERVGLVRAAGISDSRLQLCHLPLQRLLSLGASAKRLIRRICAPPRSWR